MTEGLLGALLFEEHLRPDIAVFEALLYKNKNQHRHANYFQRLCEVRRSIRRLDLPGVQEALRLGSPPLQDMIGVNLRLRTVRTAWPLHRISARG